MKRIHLRLFQKKKLSIPEIVEGCQAGDAHCQELLFKTYVGDLMTVCRRYEHPSFGAQDILQETFMSVFKNMHQYDPEKSSILTWMKRIAVNTSLKKIRGRRLDFVDIENHPNQIAESEVDDVETVSEEYLIALINELPQGYRTIFNMYVIEGFTHKEIADYLDISVQTSKSQLSKAKKMLRSRLKVEDEKVLNRNFKKSAILLLVLFGSEVLEHSINLTQ